MSRRRFLQIGVILPKLPKKHFYEMLYQVDFSKPDHYVMHINTLIYAYLSNFNYITLLRN